MANASNLIPNLYIYNLSKKWGGHSSPRIALPVSLAIIAPYNFFN